MAKRAANGTKKVVERGRACARERNATAKFREFNELISIEARPAKVLV
jgi:hypothetical protein